MIRIRFFALGREYPNKSAVGWEKYEIYSVTGNRRYDIITTSLFFLGMNSNIGCI